MEKISKIAETYRITIRSLKGNLLFFTNVQSYSVNDGFIEFIDEKTGDKKIFSSSNAEIEVEK